MPISHSMMIWTKIDEIFYIVWSAIFSRNYMVRLYTNAKPALWHFAGVPGSFVNIAPGGSVFISMRSISNFLGATVASDLIATRNREVGSTIPTFHNVSQVARIAFSVAFIVMSFLTLTATHNIVRKFLELRSAIYTVCINTGAYFPAPRLSKKTTSAPPVGSALGTTLGRLLGILKGGATVNTFQFHSGSCVMDGLLGW
jgi:hypothetical protein